MEDGIRRAAAGIRDFVPSRNHVDVEARCVGAKRLQRHGGVIGRICAAEADQDAPHFSVPWRGTLARGRTRAQQRVARAKEESARRQPAGVRIDRRKHVLIEEQVAIVLAPEVVDRHDLLRHAALRAFPLCAELVVVHHEPVARLDLMLPKHRLGAARLERLGERRATHDMAAAHGRRAEDDLHARRSSCAPGCPRLRARPSPRRGFAR